MTLQHDFVDTSLRLFQGGLLLTCQFAERLPDPQQNVAAATNSKPSPTSGL
jgi:hypothetical protein